MAGVVPPVLNACAMEVLEEYVTYVNLGGEIPLVNCAMEVVWNRLDESKVWVRMSFEELSKALLNAFAPRSVFAFYGLCYE